MRTKPGKMQRLVSNLVAGLMPNKKLRGPVRQWIRCERMYAKRRYRIYKQQWRERSDTPIIPGRHKEYDLVFAIGTACPTSDILSVFQLRKISTPLDWTGGRRPSEFEYQPNVWRDSRFNEKIHAVCTEFKDYFNFEDMALRCSHFIQGPHHEMINTRNNINFLHLFPVDISWEKYFPTARETIMRRGRRLIDQINRSDKILIVWAHRTSYLKNFLDMTISDEDIKRAVKMLNKKWPGKHFDLVFFEHDGFKQKFAFDKIAVCEGAYRIRSNHFEDVLEYCDVRKNNEYLYKIPLVMAEMLDNIKLVDSD